MQNGSQAQSVSYTKLREGAVYTKTKLQVHDEDYASAFTSDVKNSWSFTFILFYVFKERILVTSWVILLFTRNDLIVTTDFQEDRITVMVRALYLKIKFYEELFFISG
jgi:hypothetical protein